MTFLNRIISWIFDIALFFLDLSHEVRDWGSWAYWAADFLVDIADAFAHLGVYFGDFNDWVEYAADVIGDILSWSSIRSLIRSWLYGIESALDWFQSWTTWVGQYITDWWAGILPYVLSYVDDAVEGLDSLIAAWGNFWTVTFPQWTSKLDNLIADWDNFWTMTFPTLVSFTWLTTWWTSTIGEVQGLIDSAFTLRDSLWAGWQEMRDQVIEFFADPLEWLWERFTDWFLGPEE